MTENQKKRQQMKKMRKPRSSYREQPTGKKMEINLGHPSFLVPKTPLKFIDSKPT
jgi:hypothetical protein